MTKMETLVLWLWPLVVFAVLAGVAIYAMRSDRPRHPHPGE